MDNPLLSSKSALLIRKLRKKKLTLKSNLIEKTSLDRTKFHNYKELDKSFNFKSNDTTKNIFPSLSSIKSKYYTKVNSRNSSPNDDFNNERDSKSTVKTKFYNRQKITLKLPEKVRNNMIKRENNYFKTENNQKIIFNNIGINYHKMKYNNNINNNTNYQRRSVEKKDNKTNKEINKLNNNIKVLLVKNNKLQNEKNENESKIEILEQKIDKLITYIKDNETLNQKDKIIPLENEIITLRKENEQLKNDLKIKNEVISSLQNKNNRVNDFKNSININNKNNTDENDIDIEKLKNISIDPDDI